MTTSGIRVYRLAYELELESAVVLERARRLGFGTGSQLSMLNPQQRSALEKDLRRFPPDEPPAGVTSRLRPRGPGPHEASQAMPEPAPDDDDA